MGRGKIQWGAFTITGLLDMKRELFAQMGRGKIQSFTVQKGYKTVPREPTHLLGHAVRADFALRRRRRATESDATLAKLAKRHRETWREGRHGAKVALQLNGKGTLYFTTTHLSEK